MSIRSNANVLVVLEGPAGCGKSTAIQELLRTGRGYLPSQITKLERPRSYVGNQGVLLASLKDQATTLGFVDNAINGVGPTFADRWCISQWVYDSLRRGGPINGPAAREQLLAMVRQLRATYEEFSARLGKVASGHSESPLYVHFVMVIPTWTSLELNRQFALQADGRDFPYTIQAEVNAYREAAAIIMGMLNSRANTPLTAEGNVRLSWEVLWNHENRPQNDIVVAVNRFLDAEPTLPKQKAFAW